MLENLDVDNAVYYLNNDQVIWHQISLKLILGAGETVQSVKTFTLHGANMGLVPAIHVVP